jgi:hypothetical protein
VIDLANGKGKGKSKGKNSSPKAKEPTVEDDQPDWEEVPLDAQDVVILNQLNVDIVGSLQKGKQIEDQMTQMQNQMAQMTMELQQIEGAVNAFSHTQKTVLDTFEDKYGLGGVLFTLDLAGKKLVRKEAEPEVTPDAS